MSTPSSTPAIEQVAASTLKIPKVKKSIQLPKIDTSVLLAGGGVVAAPTQELAKYQKMSDKEHILKKPDT